MKYIPAKTGQRKDVELYFWSGVLVLYVIPNAYVFLTALNAQTIRVDLQTVASRLAYFKALACIVLVLASLFFVICCARAGRKFFPALPGRRPIKTAGKLVFVLQVMGLMSALLLDFGRVGGAATSSSSVAVLISYLNPDMFFLIYYAHARSRKMPYANLAVFVISSSIRGWGGFWVIFFLVEFYYAAQRLSGRRLLATLLLMMSAALIALPYVSDIRDKARGTVATKDLTYADYFDNMLQRLQQLTAVALIAQEAREIKAGIRQGQILPYYRDNQIAEKLERDRFRPKSLQKILTTRYLIDMQDVPPGQYLEDVGWHTNTGIAGWLFVLDWKHVPFYLLFVAALIIFPYWVLGRFIGERSLLPMLHVVALIYVFQGWFGVQIGFCIALILYAFLVNFLRAKPQAQPIYVFLPSNDAATAPSLQNASPVRFTMPMQSFTGAEQK